MKARALAKMLLRHPDFEVIAYDDDAEEFMPVSGTIAPANHIVDGESVDAIELCTDDPND